MAAKAISRSLRHIGQKFYDVIVVGGGINGAGIARDSASRGLATLLVERRDFGGGTTSRSTKLIHGGLRYLEHGEFGLVSESLREREVLLKIAGHLVRPLPLIIAIYRGDPYSCRQVKMGMILYDLLSLDKSLPRHRKLSKGEVMRLEPDLRIDDLVGAFLYYDAQIVYPERLVVENIISAREHGADVLNYAEAIQMLVEGQRGRVCGVRVRDRLSGEVQDVRGRMVVNASGPWVDAVCKLLSRDAPRRIGGTKGSHLVLYNHRKSPRHAIYATARSDGRPFFIVPWKEYLIVGTTDIRYDGDLDEVKASDDEIDYLLGEANRLLNTPISKEEILYTYSGVRPLPYEPDVPEGKITRRHIIYDHEREEKIPGFISIIGGKITTYRNLAQQVVDLVCRRLHKATARVCRTDLEPLAGGGGSPSKDEVAEAGRRWQLEPGSVMNLYGLYGARYKDVLALIDEDKSLGDRFCPNNPDIKAQIVYAIEQEMAVTLADILLRRTAIGWTRCLGLDCARAAAETMGRYLGWASGRIDEEVQNYKSELEKTYGMPRGRESEAGKRWTSPPTPPSCQP